MKKITVDMLCEFFDGDFEFAAEVKASIEARLEASIKEHQSLSYGSDESVKVYGRILWLEDFKSKLEYFA